jgi:hypothetical protein
MKRLGKINFYSGYDNLTRICNDCLKYYKKYEFCYEFSSSEDICDECGKRIFCNNLYKDSLDKKSHWEIRIIQLRRKKGDKKFEIEEEVKKRFLVFFTNLGEKILTEADYVSETGFRRFIEERERSVNSIIEIVCRELVEKDIFIPRIGDKIYIEGAMYLSHAIDDFAGGLATVTKVRGREKHMISVKEVSGEFAWEGYLAEKQEDLKELYGKNKAGATPDYSPEFNEPW